MSNLLGIWIFSAIFYQGQMMNPPNPHLHIFLTFQNESINEIYYYRDNENGFCRRTAEYRIENGMMTQKVISVDPDNKSECSLDTDMQMNNVSTAPLWIENEQLHLQLPLGEENIQYIFNRKIE